MGVLVDITTRCNMTCGHCMWSRTQQGEDMTEEIFRAALNMKPVRRYGTFSLGSGEPTVHPNFWEFLNIAIQDKRWRVRVVTNGKLTEICLRLAELAKQGIIEAHLSLDKWHDPIEQNVIEAFKRDEKNPNDKRAYRFCEDEDLKNVGRCDFAEDKRPSCRCPVPKITPNGNVYFCGCELAKPIGHVLTGWDEQLVKNPRLLNCSRYDLNADSKAPMKFFVGISRILRKGIDRVSIPQTKRQKMEKLIQKMDPFFKELGEYEILGSYARGAENPKDIDVLLITQNEINFKELIEKIGGTQIMFHKFRVTFKLDGIHIELFHAKQEYLGSARLYLEGPAKRNANLRKLARDKNLIWKFGGLFSEDGKLLASNDKDLLFQMIVKDGIENT